MQLTLEADYAVRIVYVLGILGEKTDAKSISEKAGVTLRFSLKIQPAEQRFKPRGGVILRNVGLMRHRVYLCVAAALVDIHFVVVKQRQEPFGSLGLSRSIDYRNRFFVQLGHFFVSVGAQHGAR